MVSEQQSPAPIIHPIAGYPLPAGALAREAHLESGDEVAAWAARSGDLDYAKQVHRTTLGTAPGQLWERLAKHDRQDPGEQIGFETCFTPEEARALHEIGVRAEAGHCYLSRVQWRDLLNAIANYLADATHWHVASAGSNHEWNAYLERTRVLRALKEALQ